MNLSVIVSIQWRGYFGHVWCLFRYQRSSDKCFFRLSCCSLILSTYSLSAPPAPKESFNLLQVFFMVLVFWLLTYILMRDVFIVVDLWKWSLSSPEFCVCCLLELNEPAVAVMTTSPTGSTEQWCWIFCRNE